MVGKGSTVVPMSMAGEVAFRPETWPHAAARGVPVVV
jgi:hypothetical protein